MENKIEDGLKIRETINIEILKLLKEMDLLKTYIFYAQY